MKSTAIVSFSLPREDVELLDRLATRAGSRSSAVRELIARHRKAERDKQLEEAYRAYYADPANQRFAQQWTRAVLRHSSFLNEGVRRGGKSGKKGRTTR